MSVGCDEGPAVKKTPTQQEEDRLEEKMLRARAKGNFDTMFLFLLALVPLLCPLGNALLHLQRPAMCLLVIFSLTLLAFKCAERSRDGEARRATATSELLALAGPLLAHAATIAYDGDVPSLFLKLVGTVWLPTSASISCSSSARFTAFMALHVMLVLFRFRKDWEAGAPWIASALALGGLLRQAVAQQEEQRKLRMQLATACMDLERVAERTTQDIFERLCDASVKLTSCGEVQDAAPQLEAMLGLQPTKLQGRSFSSMVHHGDLREWNDLFEVAMNDSQVRRVQLRLLDVFGQPVPVHIFHAHFTKFNRERLVLLGVSESWRPPKAKQATLKSPSHAKRSGTVKHTLAAASSTLADTLASKTPGTPPVAGGEGARLRTRLGDSDAARELKELPSLSDAQLRGAMGRAGNLRMQLSARLQRAELGASANTSSGASGSLVNGLRLNQPAETSPRAYRVPSPPPAKGCGARGQLIP